MRRRAAKTLLQASALLPAAIFMLWAAGTAAQTGSGADLTGSAWLAGEVGGQGVVDGARTTLEFAEAGRVGGNAGCNRYFGPVSIEGDVLAFGNLAATRMMCAPALIDQEERFLRALRDAKRFELRQDGGQLLIYGDGSEPLIQLSRIIEK